MGRGPASAMRGEKFGCLWMYNVKALPIRRVEFHGRERWFEVAKSS